MLTAVWHWPGGPVVRVALEKEILGAAALSDGTPGASLSRGRPASRRRPHLA